MDPDEKLARIQSFLERWYANYERPVVTVGEIADFIQDVRDLDEWLSKGGYPPAVWRREK